MTPRAAARDEVFALADEIVGALASHRPALATFAGIRDHDARWGDLGPESAAAWDGVLASFESRLRALGAPSDPDATLALRIAEELVRDHREAFAAREHLSNLNSIESTFQHVRQVFEMMPTSTAGDAENVAARLETVDRALAGYFATLDEGRRAGVPVAKRQVVAVIAQARATAGAESFLLTLPAALAGAIGSDGALARRLEAAVERGRAAFAAFADRLEADYLPHASEREPVGRERYLRAARRFLGMDLDPLETYAWGWSEVHALEREMAHVAAEILPGAPVPEVIRHLTTDPARCVSSAAELLDAVRTCQHDAIERLDGRHFDLPAPIRRIEVRLAPAGGALGAYYVPPSEDFSRPGTIWYAPGDKSRFPLYDEIATAYHEGFPGHHLQCSIQVLRAERLSRLHRLFVFHPGHGEGWALYAERLMHELGHYEKPDYVLGMLAAQLARACRVVVDIGLHLELPIPAGDRLHGGAIWNHAIAVDVMQKRAFFAPDLARSEVVRYLGWPAQAISYKVGERVLRELREERRRRDGAAFDLKAFHEDVIGSGVMGLGLLRERVLAG